MVINDLGDRRRRPSFCALFSAMAGSACCPQPKRSPAVETNTSAISEVVVAINKSLVLLIYTLATSCSQSERGPKSESQLQLGSPASVTILSSERPGAVSGVVASFATITTEEVGALGTIYVGYFNSAQFLPASGDRCTIEYVMSDRPGPMARSIQCNGGSWAYPRAPRT